MKTRKVVTDGWYTSIGWVIVDRVDMMLKHTKPLIKRRLKTSLMMRTKESNRRISRYVTVRYLRLCRKEIPRKVRGFLGFFLRGFLFLCDYFINYYYIHRIKLLLKIKKLQTGVVVCFLVFLLWEDI